MSAPLSTGQATVVHHDPDASTCSCSAANGLLLAPHVRVPVLHLGFGADVFVYPSHHAARAGALPSELVEADMIAGAEHNPRRRPAIVEAVADRLVAGAG